MPPAVPASSRPAAADHNNNFNLLRLGAATAVLVSHSYALTTGVEPHVGVDSLGHVAVLVFFAISGFLVTQSWARQPSLGAFIVKRALRIMPALIAVVAITALVMGPLVTTLPLDAYFSAHGTFGYIVKNVFMRPEYELPGVFASNPFPLAVNGSLWTLEHEVRAYIAVAVIGVLGLWRDRRVATVVLVALLLADATSHSAEGIIGDDKLMRGFVVGALLLIWRDRIKWSWTIATTLLAVWVLLGITAHGTAQEWMAAASMGYAAIVFAYRTPPSWDRLLRRQDLSDGVYLCAFPIQQLIANQWHSISAPAMIAIALPLTLIMAFLSWRLVEKPALRFKRFAARRALVPVPAPAPSS